MKDSLGNYPGWLQFWGEVLTFVERIESTEAAKKAYEAGFLAGVQHTASAKPSEDPNWAAQTGLPK